MMIIFDCVAPMHSTHDARTPQHHLVAGASIALGWERETERER